MSTSFGPILTARVIQFNSFARLLTIPGSDLLVQYLLRKAASVVALLTHTAANSGRPQSLSPHRVSTRNHWMRRM